MKPSAVMTLGAALLVATAALSAEPAKKIQLSDPKGDDKGPGTYVYPSNPVYTAGSFDLRGLQVIDKGSTVEFRVKVGARIADPWNSKEWDGNGFSLQFVQIYIDTDHKAGSGFTGVLPGLGKLKLAADQAWDKVVLISPQGKQRLKSEARYKSGKMAKAVVIPRATRARGKTLIAVVKKSDLGQPNKGWGLQAIMQSNEGFPKGKDILTRPVNEVRGDHRFGGGHDTDCDPQVIDIFAGKGAGAPTEVKAQQTALAWKCGSKVATLPMIYPFAR